MRLVSGNGNVSEYLLYAEQQIIPNAACLGFYDSDKELITPDVACSLSVNARQHVSQGDVGAPLVIKETDSEVYTLIGLVSFILKNGNIGRFTPPVVCTRITSHFDFIVRVTGYQIRP